MTQVYAFTVHVTGTPGSIMPPELGGAYVRCYATGPDHEVAGRRIVAKLRADGLNVEEVRQQMLQFDASQWALHVKDNWPEYAADLASQAEFDEAMAEGRVVYGPFGGYNPQ